MAASGVAELPPPLPSPWQPGKCDADKCPWWPYSSSQDFKANTVMILAVLISLLICGLAVNAMIRYIIVLHCRRRRRSQRNEDVEKAAEEEIPAVIYSAEMKAAGLEAECSICLSEFSDGDKIKVLEKCKHWFHLQCVQKWLISQATCPICRTDCSSKTPSSSSQSQCMN